FLETMKLMRARAFDLAALFQNAFEAALLAWLGGARLRVGFAGQGRSLLLTHRLRRGPESRNRHQIYDYLDIVAECERVCLGGNLQSQISDPLPSLVAGPGRRRAAESLLRRFGGDSNSRPLIALNAGATNSRAKRWPEDRFAAVADQLIAELDPLVIFIRAASERDGAQRNVRRMTRLE